MLSPELRGLNKFTVKFGILKAWLGFYFSEDREDITGVFALQPCAPCRDELAYAAFCGLEPQEGDREASSAQALLHEEELILGRREMIPDLDN